MTHNHTNAVTSMMQSFSLNYPGFTIDDPMDDHNEPLPSIKKKQWIFLLEEYSVEVIRNATLHIIATRKNEYNWAPDIAYVREQCLNLSSGMLTTPTGVESWANILAKIAEPKGCENPLRLTDLEEAAKVQTMGKNAIYDLKHGIIPNISFARRDYIEAFDSLVARQRLEIMTPASVKQLLDKNAPVLPAPVSKSLPASDELKPMSLEEAREEFGAETIKNLENLLGKDGANE